MAKIEKTTMEWTTGLLTKAYGLQRVLENHPLLTAWIQDAEQEVITDEEKAKLERLRLKLLKRVNSWNEETLKMRFIALILDLVDYETTDFEPLFANEISAKVANYDLKVKADFMIAKTIDDVIETPYFYFHEYKRKKKYQDDPVAQVLLAMLISQEKNQDGKPIYGCHVIGENWYFMVMQGKEYAIDMGFVATKSEELLKIYSILKRFKAILKDLEK